MKIKPNGSTTSTFARSGLLKSALKSKKGGGPTTDLDKVEEVSIIDDPNYFKDLDQFVDPEALRAYVKELMLELSSNHSSTHPSILKGESVEAIVRETERHKKSCEQVEKKLNDIRMQTEV